MSCVSISQIEIACGTWLNKKYGCHTGWKLTYLSSISSPPNLVWKTQRGHECEPLSLCCACIFKVCRLCFFVARNTIDTNPSKIAQIVRLASEEAAESEIQIIPPCTMMISNFSMWALFVKRSVAKLHKQYYFLSQPVQVTHFIISHRNIEEKTLTWKSLMITLALELACSHASVL